jgi:D-amino-acid dehydrogenase
VTKHVVIVGGGIIGLCSAYYVRQQGFEVTVLERGSEGQASCSTGNAGMIVPSHFVPLAAPGMIAMGLKMLLNPRSPFGFKMPPTVDQLLWSWKFARSCTKRHVESSESILRDLNLFSRAAYESLVADLGVGYELHTRGLLALFKSEEKLEHEAKIAERANEIGVRAEVIDGDEVNRRETGTKVDAVGAVHFLDDAHLTPHSLLGKLRLWLVENGVKIVYGQEVNGIKWNKESIQAVQVVGQEFHADEFVFAAGVWSTSLAKSLDLKLPMMAGKGYSMMLSQPAQTPEICSLLMEARVAVTPMTDGLRVAGTMEIGTPDDKINLKRVEGIRAAVPQYYPEIKFPEDQNLPIWHGHRPCSPDGLPFLGRTSRAKNVVIATGHSMMGLSLGPITGKIVSDLLAGGKTELSLAPLNPERYG